MTVLDAIVVGSGWGAHAARALAARTDVRLVAIVGRGSPRTEALAAELGVVACADLESALALGDVSLAVVAAGQRAHVTVLERLIAGRTHVLCAHPVATLASDVARLATLARAHGVLAATDYTFRLLPQYAAARSEAMNMGALLRLHFETPGRTQIIAVDLAIDLAGPVEVVYVARRYPKALAARVAQRPSSFPPTMLLEHTSGTVTTLVPVPHADPSTAYRVMVSAENGRIDLELPAGDARHTRSLGGDTTEQSVIIGASNAHGVSAYGAGMRVLLDRFVDALLGRESLHAPLDEEIHRREVWAALEHSARSRAPITVSGS